MPAPTLTRRQFAKALGAGALTAPLIVRHLFSAPPSRVLRHASFGASNMAWADLQAICSNPFVQLVAVAEVDRNRLGDVLAAFPDVKVYQDWRELLDQERDLDSVNVSTPDHQHAVMALAAMERGKHVYGQKPLAHDLHETRALTDYARRHPRLVTQMGIQIHSEKSYRTAVALIQSGAIGLIREVHTWSNKKWGDQGPPPPVGDPVPEGFDWDLWLGGCAERPFVGRDYYHPGNWRKRLDFGTGTFGDMGCHIFDPVFEGLALTAPLSVRSEGPAPDAWNWSTDAVIRYVFPGTRYTEAATIPITWYDGDQRPPAEIRALVAPANPPARASTATPARPADPRDEGSILIGTKGVLHLPHPEMPRLCPVEQFKDYLLPQVTGSHHWSDWAEACVGGAARPLAPFAYSGPLTETVLLGSVAVRFPQTTLRWNSARLRFENERAANAFVRRRYRRGWRLGSV
ncbi:Gfo/Idh/MocA family protein [Opitutus terrae]|uniref:Oxidoreductase domain protein n=1 Tax=Opitutus terrae (strain DSM 11246 / JCM 15787 / PB90-1) TaxID=452637 RepID=B1ZV72_OPITP|nr:Gfo/Idh/MocA family oxidoreductase [Opitutus terrae]ACB76739.1 oxidoreductase domain protein [Opitutus terrae PB90-1]